ncbi:DNA polymerase III subunit delta' [Prochlorococcus marinus]|uniref:DNA polymerase III subunit delta' n=1 Tax=Prochlorococcus marinus TaxID=1219 RepID=UPI0022B42612|nr:DNA polymerase III subunit delta' [Prochlorococcus marinus]
MSNNYSLFEDFPHQPLATNILLASLKVNHIAPTYLFSGPKGVGQKEIAMRFFEGIINKEENSIKTRRQLENMQHPDLLVIEPTYLYQGKIITQSIAKSENLSSHLSPQIRLDQIQEIKKFSTKKPIESTISMVLLEDVHLLNESASNALLKTIEEPTNAIFILISSMPDKLINTIKSRCQRIAFKPFSSEILKNTLDEYSEKLDFDSKSIQEEIIALSQGSPELLIKNINLIKNIPKEILSKSVDLPKEQLKALMLAKNITDELNSEQQIWLIDWMQHFYWRKQLDINKIKRLEQLKTHLRSSINQKIAWEIALIDIIDN